MLITRDRDGRPILPLERIEALDQVVQRRVQLLEAGELPYPEDWPLPSCLECGAAVERWGRSGGGEHPMVYLFSPCGHVVVADRADVPKPMSQHR